MWFKSRSLEVSETMAEPKSNLKRTFSEKAPVQLQMLLVRCCYEKWTKYGEKEGKIQKIELVLMTHSEDV